MKLIHTIILIISFFYSYSQTSQDSLIEDRSLLDSVNHVYIPKNLAECFTQLDLCLNDSARLRYMNLKEDDLSWFHFGLGMQLRNKWVLWGGSRLAKFFNETGIYHPDDMSSIILLSYHRILNCKDIGLEEQVKYYQDFWGKHKPPKTLSKEEKDEIMKKTKEENLKWLSENNIPIMKLFKVDSNLVKMTCDSTLVIKQIKEDSIFIWTTSFTQYFGGYYNKEKELLNNINDEKGHFGKSQYVKIDNNGDILYISLGRKVFRISADSLFELEKRYTISEDSASNLFWKISGWDEEPISTADSNKYSAILHSNTYQVFKLIYCKSMFSDSTKVFYNSESLDTIILTGYWEYKNQKYYEITINNQLSGGAKTSYSYRIDDVFKFVDYEGCNREEMEGISWDKNLIDNEEH